MLNNETPTWNELMESLYKSIKDSWIPRGAVVLSAVDSRGERTSPWIMTTRPGLYEGCCVNGTTPLLHDGYETKQRLGPPGIISKMEEPGWPLF